MVYVVISSFIFIFVSVFQSFEEVAVEWFEIYSASPTPIITRYLGSLIWNCYSSSRINLQTIWNCNIWWIWLRFKIPVKYFFWGWMYLCPIWDFWKIFWLFSNKMSLTCVKTQHFSLKKWYFETTFCGIGLSILLYRICFMTFMVPFQNWTTWDCFTASCVLSSIEIPTYIF